ncbi:hypothetical protein F4811DRAFT_529259, partial [Daldinia bambusicola]
MHDTYRFQQPTSSPPFRALLLQMLSTVNVDRIVHRVIVISIPSFTIGGQGSTLQITSSFSSYLGLIFSGVAIRASTASVYCLLGKF